MEEENYSEAQLFEYQARQLQQVIETVDTQLNEIKSIISALRDLDAVKENSEVLFPVANGIFFKGMIGNDKMLRINVGNNIVVEKSIADSIMMMEHQVNDINDYRNQVSAQIELLASRLESRK